MAGNSKWIKCSLQPPPPSSAPEVTTKNKTKSRTRTLKIRIFKKNFLLSLQPLSFSSEVQLDRPLDFPASPGPKWGHKTWSIRTQRHWSQRDYRNFGNIWHRGRGWQPHEGGLDPVNRDRGLFGSNPQEETLWGPGNHKVWAIIGADQRGLAGTMSQENKLTSCQGRG